jgi:hypothetical protein
VGNPGCPGARDGSGLRARVAWWVLRGAPRVRAVGVCPERSGVQVRRACARAPREATRPAPREEPRGPPRAQWPCVLARGATRQIGLVGPRPRRRNVRTYSCPRESCVARGTGMADCDRVVTPIRFVRNARQAQHFPRTASEAEGHRRPFVASQHFPRTAAEAVSSDVSRPLSNTSRHQRQIDRGILAPHRSLHWPDTEMGGVDATAVACPGMRGAVGGRDR